jgi:thiaminase/transcriptional activator TenA
MTGTRWQARAAGGRFVALTFEGSVNAAELSKMTPAAPLTSSLWEQAQPIYAAIQRHPFVTGLTAGTLQRDRFAFYITQDALYLRHFARCLMALGASAPPEATALFGRHATDALKVEQDLHEGVVRALGLHAEQVRGAAQAPTCLAYTSFLLAGAFGRPFHEGLAAILPCYWIYQKLGKELLAKGSPEPLYQRWIATYGGEPFDKAVREILDLADATGARLTEAERSPMRNRFLTACRYEWMFFDMAHSLERWPV